MGNTWYSVLDIGNYLELWRNGFLSIRCQRIETGSTPVSSVKDINNKGFYNDDSNFPLRMKNGEHIAIVEQFCQLGVLKIP